MLFLIGFGNLIFWYLLCLLIFRQSSWKSGVFQSRNTFAKPMFLLNASILIIVTNAITFSFFSVYNHLGIAKIVIPFFSVNIIPVTAISLYFILRNRLIKIKRTQDQNDAKNREKIENWLACLQSHANNLEIHYYIYTVDGQITGKILAKYKNTESQQLLMESRNWLPDSVSLEIKPTDNSNTIH